MVPSGQLTGAVRPGFSLGQQNGRESVLYEAIPIPIRLAHVRIPRSCRHKFGVLLAQGSADKFLIDSVCFDVASSRAVGWRVVEAAFDSWKKWVQYWIAALSHGIENRVEAVSAGWIDKEFATTFEIVAS